MIPMKNKEILTAAFAKNPALVMDTFNKKLSHKILQKIEVKKAETGTNFFRELKNNK